MSIRCLPALLACLTLLPALRAETPKPVHEVRKLSETLYELRTKDAGYICKILASVGPDGVLLVESESKEHVPALLEELKKLGGGFPRIVINSHSHGEHWDGNIALGKAPLYIGHEQLRKVLQSGPWVFSELDEGVLPRLLVKDELSLHFNGEEIRIKSFAGAHDNSDLVIWFTKSKVAFVGALATACKLPTVDGAKGDIRRYPEMTRKVLDWLPEDVTLVPGHGEDATHAQGRQFLEMLEKTAAIVKEGLAKGRTLKELTDADVLKDWASWEVSYSNRKYWLQALYEGYSGATAARYAKKSIHEPLHRALKEKGLAGIRPAYAALKTQSRIYRLDDASLLNIMFTLEDHKRDAEAQVFAELALAEFPDSPYLSYARVTLAQIHLRQGDKPKAIELLKTVLTAHPKHKQAAELLQQIEGK